MFEQWFVLTLEPGPRPALVLDTSESAAKIAPFLRSLAEGVLEAMPESSQPRIFFLGNPQPYEPAEFMHRGEELFRQNAGRGSLIGPVFETLETEPDVMVAIAGAGRIFDLPDWRNHPLAQRAIWMKVGPIGLTDGLFEEEMYACEQLAEKLNNPLSHVEISGPGVMPVWWDDPAFRYEEGQLVGQKTSGSLRFGVLTPEMDAVQAAVVMSNQARRELRLEPGVPPSPSEEIRLPHAEFMLLRQCLNKNNFHCPVCQQDHPAGTFRCQTNTELPLFPTIEALPAGGFVMIDAGAWETRLRPHPCSVLQLGPDTVAVRQPTGGARVLRFDPSINVWQPSRNIALFERLEDKRYAMVR